MLLLKSEDIKTHLLENCLSKVQAMCINEPNESVQLDKDTPLAEPCSEMRQWG